MLVGELVIAKTCNNSWTVLCNNGWTVLCFHILLFWWASYALTSYSCIGWLWYMLDASLILLLLKWLIKGAIYECDGTMYILMRDILCEYRCRADFQWLVNLNTRRIPKFKDVIGGPVWGHDIVFVCVCVCKYLKWIFVIILNERRYFYLHIYSILGK